MSEIESFFPIDLPSKCLVYDGVKPEDIKIRAYRGIDEIYLSEITPMNLDRKFLQVLRSVVQGIDPEKLTLGDRLYIIVWEYIKSYTNISLVSTTCSCCLKEIEVDVNLGELDVIPLPDNFKQPYSVKLPVSGETINLRLLTVKDEIEAIEFEEKSKYGLIYRCAKSIVDDTNIIERMEKVKQMVAADVAKIRAFHEKFYHGPNMMTKFKCINCGSEEEIEVPFRFDFFFPRSKVLARTFGAGI